MIGFLVIIVSIVAGAMFSYWFFVVTIVLCLWKLHKWYYYHSKPWRVVHFKMMRTYAQACGLETNQAEQESRKFDFMHAVVLMLDLLNPVKLKMSHEQVYEQETLRLSAHYDVSLISEYLKKINQPQEKTEFILSEVKKDIDSANEIHTKELIVRMVIAFVIEVQFSKMDRSEYMYNVFIGRAI